MSLLLRIVLVLSILEGIAIYKTADAAVNWTDAQLIFNQLVVKSGLKNVPPLKLFRVPIPNAFTDSNGITVTLGMLLFSDKSGLAAVLGHELTHYKYQDSLHIPMEYQEITADREGLLLSQSIGFNRCASLMFMLKYIYMYGDEGYYPHPKWSIRYNLLKGNCTATKYIRG